MDLTLQRRVFDNKVGLNIQTNGKWPNICFIYLYVCTFQTVGFYQKGKILTTISHNRTYYLLAYHLHSIRYNDNETETRSRWKLNKRDKNNNAQWATWMPYTPQIGVNKRCVHIVLVTLCFLIFSYGVYNEIFGQYAQLSVISLIIIHLNISSGR